MLLFVNFVVFELAWLACVVGAAEGTPWAGPLVVAAAVALHLRFARQPFDEIMLIVACALIGAAFDSLLVAARLVSYDAGQVSDLLAPYWIVAMWMLFATTLNVSMRWMRGRPLLAASFGFVGGPAAYLAGQALGGINLDQQSAALVALATGWAAMMPVLVRLSEILDGMPGQRRRWVAESAA